MKRIALLLTLATIAPAAAQVADNFPTSGPFFREQIRAAQQQPATRAETPREIELRKCFETGPRDESRPKWVGQCIKEAAGK